MLKFPGRKIYSNYNVYETELTVKILFNNQDIKNKLKKPTIQCSLEEKKVNQMYDEYKKFPFFFRCKNKLVIVYLNNNYFLVDGQHRYEMLRKIYENDNNSNEIVNVVWYPMENEDKIIELFKSLNKDSYKNQNWIELDNF